LGGTKKVAFVYRRDRLGGKFPNGENQVKKKKKENGRFHFQSPPPLKAPGKNSRSERTGDGWGANGANGDDDATIASPFALLSEEKLIHCAAAARFPSTFLASSPALTRQKTLADIRPGWRRRVRESGYFPAGKELKKAESGKRWRVRGRDVAVRSIRARLGRNRRREGAAAVFVASSNVADNQKGRGPPRAKKPAEPSSFRIFLE
jgi:hypothetical protein